MKCKMNHFLLTQAVGRIACTDGEKPYIVPVTYMFDGKDIVGQTKEGKKLTICVIIRIYALKWMR